MARIAAMITALLVLSFTTPAPACVGKTLFIGISGTPQEHLLAELVSVLVTERTGTTAKILVYPDSRELYGAVRQGKVGLVIENTDRAMDILGKAREGGGRAPLESVKADYRRTLNLVWLEPFGVAPGTNTSQLYAPVIAMDLLGNLPALPKLLQKLAGVAADSNYVRLASSVKGEEKAKKMAREYLKSRKLI
jgi:glycine betaine/choline ABC-type transport system substrate-binding protein